MEYIRIFNNDSEYQQFKDGDEYITPNICLDREINGIRCTPYTPPADIIYYTSSDGNIITPYIYSDFGADIVSNTYENGQGIIKFDDDVTSIGGYAFEGCSSLTSITIPNSVTSIGDWAFNGCSSLASITIPDSVTLIGNFVFGNCVWLKAFYGKFASSDNRCLIIDGVLHSFAPAGLTEYTIPNSITSIRHHGFSCCYSLTSVTIPDSVTSIGYAAFEICTSLTEVYCKSTIPAQMSYAFNNNAQDFKIYVPTSSVNAYKTAEGWSEYAGYIAGYDFEGGGQ